jgi:hypothetical protein
LRVCQHSAKMDDYKVLRVVGKGSYGKVRPCFVVLSVEASEFVFHVMRGRGKGGMETVGVTFALIQSCLFNGRCTSCATCVSGRSM